ncbi:MAG: ComEC/Rec2 family competence protein, partial [Eggerthellaceae bacterium]|nr:ComEC/Rec2 family competence protein [Eggerthellaceae bacterium]
MNRPVSAWEPLLFFTASTWVCATALLSAEVDWSTLKCLTCFAVSFGGGAISVIAALRTRGSIFAIVAMGCCMGLAIASSGGAHLHAAMNRCADGTVKVGELRVIEDSKTGDFGTSCIAQAHLPDGSTGTVRVNLPNGMQVRCWQVLDVECFVASPAQTSINYYWSKGCMGSVSPQEISARVPKGVLGAIYNLRSMCIDRCHLAQEELGEGREDEFALIEAILYGYRDDLFASGIYQDVRTVGLAHVVAVSGAHLVIVSGFFAAMLRSMRVRRHVRIPLQCVFVLGYAAFTGLPISALRAAVMSICSASAFFTGRRSSPVSALSLCIIAMLCMHPFLAMSLSLALSCCASLGIVLLAQKISDWMDGLFSGRVPMLTQMLSVAIAAHVLTMGISAATFSQLPIIAPLSSIIATPLFTGLVCVGMLGSILAIAFPHHAALAFMPAICLSRLFCWQTQVLA